MWTTIADILIKIILALISNKQLVTFGKDALEKAVDSGVKGIGIDNKDAQDIIHTVTKSSLNSLDESVTKHFIG